MEADVTGQCYNVGRGIGTSIKELTETMLDLTGSRLEIQYEPAGLTFVTIALVARRLLRKTWASAGRLICVKA